jgi:hypothetical protein
MACPTCGALDSTDHSAESKGLILKAEAARQARRSATWVSSRVASGELRTATFAGRTYVIAESLRRLLTVEGVPSDVDLEIDKLINSARYVEAQELHQRAYPQAWGGSGIMPSSQPPPLPTELADPWHQMVARNLEGRGE